jgi:hypothetical protein
MAYTNNNVQIPQKIVDLGDDLPDTAGDDLDLEQWAALQQAYMSSAVSSSVDSGTDSVVSAAEQSIGHVNSVGAAAARLSQAQSVANVHIMSDNFIRDSITGK